MGNTMWYQMWWGFQLDGGGCRLRMRMDANDDDATVIDTIAIVGIGDVGFRNQPSVSFGLCDKNLERFIVMVRVDKSHKYRERSKLP